MKHRIFYAEDEGTGIITIALSETSGCQVAGILTSIDALLEEESVERPPAQLQSAIGFELFETEELVDEEEGRMGFRKNT